MTRSGSGFGFAGVCGNAFKEDSLACRPQLCRVALLFPTRRQSFMKFGMVVLIRRSLYRIVGKDNSVSTVILKMAGGYHEAIPRTSFHLVSGQFLSFKLVKTQSITFSLRDTANEVNNITVLGIFLDCSLSWKLHIESLCFKPSRIVFL